MTGETPVLQHTITSKFNFATLVNAQKNLVYNIALGIVQNEADAEDITQEVFIKVFDNISNFREEAALTTWMYRITVNCALDFEKQQKRQKRGGLLKRVFGDTEMLNTADFHHPGIALDKKEEAAVLFKAIKKLPDKQRAAFVLHKVDLLTNNEVANILNISLQAAESLQVRAKNNLKTYLQTYYEQHYK